MPTLGHIPRAASRLLPRVAHQCACPRAGLRNGATLRLNGAAHMQAQQRTETIGARCAEPARRACRQRTRDPGQRTPLLRVDRIARTASGAGLLANAPTVTGRNGPSRGPRGYQAVRVTRPMTRRSAQVTGRPTPVQRLESTVLPAAPAGTRCPIRTHIRRPRRPPLLYFPAVLAVRTVRISLLTSGAKRARTADLLHAIWRQHVHPRVPVQVTVLPCPYAAVHVQVSCCTFLLYRRYPRRGTSRGPRSRPDQHQPPRQVTSASFACIRSSRPQQPAPPRSAHPLHRFRPPGSSLDRRQTPHPAHPGTIHQLPLLAEQRTSFQHLLMRSFVWSPCAESGSRDRKYQLVWPPLWPTQPRIEGNGC
jgi:hypothetical protein